MEGQFDDADEVWDEDDVFVSMMQSKLASSNAAVPQNPRVDDEDLHSKLIPQSEEDKDGEDDDEGYYDDDDEDNYDDIVEDDEFNFSCVASSASVKSTSFQTSKLNLDSRSNTDMMSHSVSNAVTKMRHMETSKRVSHTGRDDRATSEQCLDPRTRLILFRMLR